MMHCTILLSQWMSKAVFLNSATECIELISVLFFTFISEKHNSQHHRHSTKTAVLHVKNCRYSRLQLVALIETSLL